MKRRTTFLISLLWLVLPVLFAGSCRREQPSNPNADALPPIVATVDDQPISTKLYQMYLANGKEALGLDDKTDAGRTRIDQLREGIVAELIDRTLVAQGAQHRGLTITPEKLAEAEQRSIRQFGGEEKYDAYLGDHHLTREEHRELIKMEIYSEMLRLELRKESNVTDDQIKDYYEIHKNDSDFQLPERVTAAHILIAARPNLISEKLAAEKGLSGTSLALAVQAEIERRRNLAEELRRKAVAGEDFAELARKFSEDPSSRDQGGSLGTFKRYSHPRAFDDAAFSLKPSEISQVVQTDFGFHVIKVLSREGSQIMTLPEASESIRERLFSALEAARLKEWLKEARSKARIHINEPFRVGSLKSEFPN